MRQEQLLNYIVQLEEKLSMMDKDLNEVKHAVVDLIEENITLQKQLEYYQNVHGEPHDTSYKDNTLQNLYDEGFHVCSTLFASPRNGEACIFCGEFIN